MRSHSHLATERGAPPYFAGRKDELRLLNDRLNRLCATRDPSDGIALILGPPGAGKTQLGQQLVNRVHDRQGKPVARFYKAKTSTLKSDVDLFMGIARSLGDDKMGREIADLDTRRTGGSFGVGKVFQRGTTNEHPRHTGGLAALLEASQVRGMWKDKVLLLVVDELQGIAPEGVEALSVLHEGVDGCPMLVVGIGLEHTQEALATRDGRTGISRPARPIKLGCLSDEEAFDAVSKGLAALGHDVPERCSMKLAGATYGFPQHVHAYLEGAHRAIEQHGHIATGAPLEDALAYGRQARNDYYNDRLRRMANPKGMLAIVAAMHGDKRWLAHADAVEAVDKAGFDGGQTIADAIAHGVLTRNQWHDVSFAIPSFHAHMLKEAQRLQA